MGEKSIRVKITAAMKDPSTLTIAPKRLANKTSTAAKRNGAAIFQCVLENTRLTPIAQSALTATPMVDCKVYSNFGFMVFVFGRYEIYGRLKIA